MSLSNDWRPELQTIAGKVEVVMEEDTNLLVIGTQKESSFESTCIRSLPYVKHNNVVFLSPDGY